jgi:hypothetical protein
MIAVNSSTVIDYLQLVESKHTQLLKKAIDDFTAVIPAVVITELMSNPSATNQALAKRFLSEVTPLEIQEGYWERAGYLRATLKARGLKAKTADALIAQSCIDHDASLLTRDHDFLVFAKYCGLKLALS